MKSQQLVAVTLFVAMASSASAENNISNSISSTADLSFRYRLEAVDMDSFTDDALASSLLTRATLKTHWHSKWDSVIEFDNVSTIGADDYNAGAGNTPDKGEYPVIADPTGTEVNQAYIRYSGESTKIAYGRQRILVANQRFIGGVAWRQNEQTFDSFTIKNQFSDQFKLNYAYIFNVNTIFGDAVAGGNNRHNTHVIDADYQLGSGRISAYYFAIDNQSVATASNETFGISYTRQWDNFGYILELATQSDAGDNPNNYSATYRWLEGSYKKENYSFTVGYEVLGGDVDGGQGFTTSLATLHKFQGWADAFIGRSDSFESAGIKDFYLKALYQIKDVELEVVAHDFSTEQGSTDLGTEFDIAISTPLTAKLTGLIKFAKFTSDSEMKSRDKLWLMLTYQP